MTARQLVSGFSESTTVLLSDTWGNKIVTTAHDFLTEEIFGGFLELKVTDYGFYFDSVTLVIECE